MKVFKGRNNSLRHQLKRTWTRLNRDYPKRLPNFLVIGATRCGTTTLHRILDAHPEIFVPSGKELHYFDNDRLYRPGLSGYRELFGGYRGQRFVGEVTPSYCEKATLCDVNGRRRTVLGDDPIRRIARAMPDARLVISLRDPLTRIKSIYLKNFNQGKISHSLEEELRKEAWVGDSALRLIGRSQYRETLQHCLSYFPKGNLKVMIFEEWTRDQVGTIPDLFSFLGADPNVSLDPVVSNNSERYRKAGDSRTPEPYLSPETRRRVIETTAESRAWLEDFLGRKFPWERE